MNPPSHSDPICSAVMVEVGIKETFRQQTLGKVGEVKLLTHLTRRDCKYSNITLRCRYLCLYDTRDARKPLENCVHSCLCSFGLSELQPGSSLLPPHRRCVWIAISRRPLFSPSRFFPLASHWGVFLTYVHQTHVSTCSKKNRPQTRLNVTSTSIWLDALLHQQHVASSTGHSTVQFKSKLPRV